jgi:hypothetical protein
VNHHTGRRGTILIIVAGVSALLAALALAFLARVRSDAEETDVVLRYAQAKIMYVAACNYVQETSRLGWSGITNVSVDGIPIHEEAFGWIDVRNGATGPLDRDKNPLYQPGSWPDIGTHVRCPMHVYKRTPYAISMDTGHNLMVREPESDPDYCWPLLKYPDPQPAVGNGWLPKVYPPSISNTNYADFVSGERDASGNLQVRSDSQGKSWFRVYRDGPATFILTCGSGGTLGYKTWSEIPANERATFGDQTVFESLRQSEVRLWYRIEWSAAVTETSYHNLHHEIATAHEHYESWPPNASHTWSSSRRTQTWMKNFVGTIRWSQRLLTEPTKY